MSPVVYTATDVQSKATEPVSKEAPVKKEAPLDAAGLRRLIVAGMTKATRPAQPIIPQSKWTIIVSQPC